MLKSSLPFVFARCWSILGFGSACLFLTLFLSSGNSFAQDEPKFSTEQIEFFESRIRPLLIDKCFECHGPEAKPLEGGLSLSSRKSALVGGDTGPAIEPGIPEESLLIDAINYGDVYEMPPDTKLPQADIDTLTQWVEMGAPWPAEQGNMVEKEKFDIAARRSAHWCWQPVKSPAMPNIKKSTWPRDSIDNFVLSKLESAKLEPADDASKRTLIRRVYFDLIGLPPSPTQIQKFLDDDSDGAFAKIVDELLASPRFGERWARHWMDLFRYAETCGHEFDYPIPHAYRYRDYLIRAFNRDVPYDQLIREHIAGDLIEQPRRHETEEFNESLIGTGFWFFGEGHHGPVDVKADEAKRIDNQIDVMSKSFLGLTVSCAKCHDHKFDAISTKDFYALAGFLKSSRRQDAMLDPGRRIEKAHSEFKQLSDEADQAIEQFVSLADQSDAQKIAEYLTAAILKLRNDPDWSRPEKVVVQGENLRVINNDHGTLTPQELKPQGERFAWQDNKQLWWVDGEPGSKATLEFDLDSVIEPQEFELFANFTKAKDYGKANIFVDGQAVLTDFDFYSEELTTTGAISLGTHSFENGKHELVLEITGHHEKAIPRHMLGIDFIELKPTKVLNGNSQEEQADFNERHQHLDQILVNNLVKAIKLSRLSTELHPLHLLQELSNGNLAIDAEWVAHLAQQIERKRNQSIQSTKDAVVFESFDHGLPERWYQTGFAVFDSQGTSTEHLSVENEWLAEPTAVHSGRGGKNYKGVIRSPTFTINHDKIFYRIKGGKARIRLIIEGYQLDLYNALLFNGMKIDFAGSEDYRWIEQSRDLKNHKGRTAHIEILDQSDGFFSIDKIILTNGPAPVDPPSKATQQIASQLSEQFENSIEAMAKRIAEQVVSSVVQSDSEAISLRSWIIENDLSAILTPAVEHNASGIAKDLQSISTTDQNISCATLAEKIKTLHREASTKNDQVPSPFLAIAMDDGPGQNEHVFIRGNHKTLGDIVERRFLEALTDNSMKIERGSGRMQLANRISDPKNPLTPRVIVNRIWHHLLGRGIVASVDNFGVLGQRPTHPKLLDHLAVRFVDNGWSIKKLIREIVLTRTYQLSSVPNLESKEADPDNKLFHAANIHRLEGEAIRDSILIISGELDETMYGPSVPIHLTPFMGGRGRPGKSGPLDGNRRRSVYIEVRRNFLSPMMLAFDTPTPFNTLGRRNRSNVPAQALILMNDPFIFDQAQKWAKRLIGDGQEPIDRINTIYLEAFGRPPTSPELKEAQTFLADYASELRVEEKAIKSNIELWRDFCHVMFNVKQFIFID